MSETHEDHVKEAKQTLERRIADMRALVDASDIESLNVNDPDPADRAVERMRAIRAREATEADSHATAGDMMEAAEERAHEYGLAWDKYLTNHRDGTVTYVHCTSTGGPGDEFYVTYALGGLGRVDDVKYVYLPWFDRVEIEPSGDDLATLTEFYERFYCVEDDES